MVIREKISAAIQDMPEDERIVKLLQGSCKYSKDSFVLKCVGYHTLYFEHFHI